MHRVNGQGRVKKALPTKLEINSRKVRQIIMHTRCLYYPLTPFCLQRALLVARGMSELREQDGKSRGTKRCTADCKITFTWFSMRARRSSDVCA